MQLFYVLRLLTITSAGMGYAYAVHLPGLGRRGLFATPTLPTAVWHKHPGFSCSVANGAQLTTYTTLTEAQRVASSAHPQLAVYDATCNGAGPFLLCSAALVPAGKNPSACVWVHGPLQESQGVASSDAGRTRAVANTTTTASVLKLYTYTKKPKVHCADNTMAQGTFLSLESAEAACSTHEQCGGVYDMACDGSSFTLCGQMAPKPSTSASCVYNRVPFGVIIGGNASKSVIGQPFVNRLGNSVAFVIAAAGVACPAGTAPVTTKAECLAVQAISGVVDAITPVSDSYYGPRGCYINTDYYTGSRVYFNTNSGAPEVRGGYQLFCRNSSIGTGTAYQPRRGCMDPNATNYDPIAQLHSFECTIASVACDFEANLCGWDNTGRARWNRVFINATSSAVQRVRTGESAVVLDTRSPSAPGWTSNLTSPPLGGETYLRFNYRMPANSTATLRLQALVAGTWSTLWWQSAGLVCQEMSVSHHCLPAWTDGWHTKTLKLPADTQRVRFMGVAGAAGQQHPASGSAACVDAGESGLGGEPCARVHMYCAVATVSKNCPLTCGLCDGKPAGTADAKEQLITIDNIRASVLPLTVNSGCSDQYGSSSICAILKTNNRLCKHKEMRTRCQRTCGDCVCKDTPPSGALPSFCEDMKLSGICAANVGVKAMCARTCDGDCASWWAPLQQDLHFVASTTNTCPAGSTPIDSKAGCEMAARELGLGTQLTSPSTVTPAWFHSKSTRVNTYSSYYTVHVPGYAKPMCGVGCYLDLTYSTFYAFTSYATNIARAQLQWSRKQGQLTFCGKSSNASVAAAQTQPEVYPAPPCMVLSDYYARNSSTMRAYTPTLCPTTQNVNMTTRTKYNRQLCQLSQPTGAPTRSPCADLNDSGMEGAPCGPAIKKFCGEALFRAKLAKNCPMTCGACNSSTPSS